MRIRVVFFALPLILGCRDPKYADVGDIGNTIPRLQITDKLIGDVTSVNDFATDDEALFLLDWRAGQIHKLSPVSGGTWRITHSFARRGDGPGELSEPVAIEFDADADELVVLERSGEMEHYSRNGSYRSSTLINLPCLAARVQMELLASRYYVAENCMAGRFSRLRGDTVYSVLAEVSSSATPRLLGVQPVSNVRGSWGSIYTAARQLLRLDDTIIFGSGVDRCTQRVLPPEPAPAEFVCNENAIQFAGPEPGSFHKTRTAVTAATAWPRPFPFFHSLTATNGRVIAARIVSADSIALAQLIGANQFFAVAPLHGLVGCKREGCLWLDLNQDPNRIRFLNARDITHLSGR